jgi:chromosome partitioning protein
LGVGKLTPNIIAEMCNMAASVIAITNPVGGVGKSSTVLAMAAGLTARKYRTLIVDLIPEGHCTYTTGINISDETLTAFDVLTNAAEISDAIVQTPIGDILPASTRLDGMNTIISVTGRNYTLKRALASVRKKYDYILIDTPPSFTMLTINALISATGVIIPASLDHRFRLKNIYVVRDIIKSVRKYTLRPLKIHGILLTKHKPRVVVLRDLAETAVKIAQQMNIGLFKTCIRECIAICHANTMRKSIFKYAPQSNGAKDYAAFITEFLKSTTNEIPVKTLPMGRRIKKTKPNITVTPSTLDHLRYIAQENGISVDEAANRILTQNLTDIKIRSVRDRRYSAAVR